MWPSTVIDYPVQMPSSKDGLWISMSTMILANQNSIETGHCLFSPVSMDRRRKISNRMTPFEIPLVMQHQSWDFHHPRSSTFLLSVEALVFLSAESLMFSVKLEILRSGTSSTHWIYCQLDILSNEYFISCYISQNRKHIRLSVWGSYYVWIQLQSKPSKNRWMRQKAKILLSLNWLMTSSA